MSLTVDSAGRHLRSGAGRVPTSHTTPMMQRHEEQATVAQSAAFDKYIRETVGASTTVRSACPGSARERPSVVGRESLGNHGPPADCGSIAADAVADAP
jgi:hypothetical protein